MTRLKMNENDNFGNASYNMLFAKVQHVIDSELQNSNIVMSDMMPEGIDVLNDEECDDCTMMNDTSKRSSQQRPQTTSMSTTITVPEFHTNEVITGRVVGRGGFCFVSELNEIRLMTKSKSTPAPAVEKSAMKADFFQGSSFGGTTTSSASIESMSKHANEHTSRHSSTDTSTPRAHLARRVWLKQGTRYVLKQVDTSSLSSSCSPSTSGRGIHQKKVQWMQATIDIMLEAKYLQSLSHPHIISVCGTVSSNHDNYGRSDQSSSLSSKVTKPTISKNTSSHPQNTLQFGIIFEHLPVMLTSKLNTWMQMQRRTMGVTGFLCRNKKQRITNLFRERLFVAHDIAEALDYLHSKNVIYRDLVSYNNSIWEQILTFLLSFRLLFYYYSQKPDNIGFDYDGILKVFDFGLAKELKQKDQDELGLYHNMTGLTGGMFLFHLVGK
jgi:serine/threonine protein kinase